MALNNFLTLAVAGSRKTQGIVDECAKAEEDERILVLTYTTLNQAEMRSRLAEQVGDRPNIEVMGWYSFLLSHFVRPFSPFLFPNSRLAGFDFDSKYQQGVSVEEESRYFTKDGFARKVHLAHLALKIDQASKRISIKRLEQIYDRIYIDEVQDLCGYDLDVLSLLLKSGVEMRLVGDVRQATLVTNFQERRNKKYFRMGIGTWLQEQEQRGLLAISHKNESYRCRPEITQFADALFAESWGFHETKSLNEEFCGQDGVFLLRTRDVEEFNARYSPLGLRVDKNKGTHLPFEYMNFGQVKGLTREHVVVVPTTPIINYLTKGKPLDDGQASSLYVAVTRAKQSVAFVLDEPGSCELPFWEP